MTNVYEAIGSYTVSGYSIRSTLVSAYLGEPKDTSHFSYEESYTLGGGVLSNIINERAAFRFRRSDSTRNCGPHWRVYDRPADWGTD